MSATQTITKQDTQTAVRIKSVKIEKLFEIFDYDIEYAKGENVLIISGPNGFGKTTILNLLYSLFNRKFHFFYNLIFDRIIVELSDENSIEIVREIKINNEQEEVTKLIFLFYVENKLLTSYNYLDDINRISKMVDDMPLSVPIGNQGLWNDRRTGNNFSIDDIVDENQSIIPLKVNFSLSKEAENTINKVGVYLIKEQRLFKNMQTRFMGEKRVESVVAYANELMQYMNREILMYNSVSQNTDSTYPTRLISEKRKITKEEYDERFTNLREKQNKLIKYGLYKEQATLDYSEVDAKALLVYLDDLEKKLSVFDHLLEKLDLFTEILNERRFTFKSIKISREKGFYFETSRGKKLQLNELSSGEKHQVILLYELILGNIDSNTLILIDEPEISLHIKWQKEFVKDLQRIIKIQNFQVMIATHAPAIINGRWDLTHNLSKDI